MTAIAFTGSTGELTVDMTEVAFDIPMASCQGEAREIMIEFRRAQEGYEWSEMYQYLRHPFTGVALCYRHDIPPNVLHIVATHSWEGDRFPRLPESIIFHHADFTDFDLTKNWG